MTYDSCVQCILFFIEGCMTLISVLDITWQLVPQAMYRAL